MHLDGLEALAKSKGGMEALLDHQLTLKFTSWQVIPKCNWKSSLIILIVHRVEILCSIAMESKPRFVEDGDHVIPPSPDLQAWNPLVRLRNDMKPSYIVSQTWKNEATRQ
jgi:hypothetical protein